MITSPNDKFFIWQCHNSSLNRRYLPEVLKPSAFSWQLIGLIYSMGLICSIVKETCVKYWTFPSINIYAHNSNYWCPTASPPLLKSLQWPVRGRSWLVTEDGSALAFSVTSKMIDTAVTLHGAYFIAIWVTARWLVPP